MKINLPEKRRARIEMLPLIDIVFLLLVFFIYAMLSMAVHRGVPVELPVSSTAAPEKESILSVTVKQQQDGESRIFVDEEIADLSRLAMVLKEKAAIEKEKSGREPGVLLFADRQVDYQQLFQVLDRINQAGLSRISLQADVEP
ncbi:MAG: biopolymer transporter ExbD [Proteobacteria bacterium]|nr:biopolymer transporter ExbD [Pseudomonadota bacterium]MBU1738578.1 biopolymer transporter ExbD [Pseudomonadota bacterium]